MQIKHKNSTLDQLDSCTYSDGIKSSTAQERVGFSASIHGSGINIMLMHYSAA